MPINREKDTLIKKIRKQTRRFLTRIVGILGGLLVIGTILDLSPFTRLFAEGEVHNIVERIFTTCVGFLCVMLAYERSSDFGNLDERLEGISSELIELQDLVRDLHSDDITQRIQRIGEWNFDPILNELFGQFIKDKVHSLIDGIEDQKITFYERDIFEGTYIEFLEKFKGRHLIATSLAHPNYFWTKEGEDDSPIEKRITQFTKQRRKNRGRMTRIFFVERDFRTDIHTISVLNKQVKELGVEVFTVSNVSQGDQDYFIIDANKEISWRLYTDGDKNLTKFVCSTNEKEIEKHHDNFKKLKANPTLKQYEYIDIPKGV